MHKYDPKKTTHGVLENWIGRCVRSCTLRMLFLCPVVPHLTWGICWCKKWRGVNTSDDCFQGRPPSDSYCINCCRWKIRTVFCAKSKESLYCLPISYFTICRSGYLFLFFKTICIELNFLTLLSYEHRVLCGHLGRWWPESSWLCFRKWLHKHSKHFKFCRWSHEFSVHKSALITSIELRWSFSFSFVFVLLIDSPL